MISDRKSTKRSVTIHQYIVFFLSIQMLLSDESDHFDLYSETEKREFLFVLFRHLCLGGAVCQYEDNVKPYQDVTKQIYKDLVRYVIK